MRLLKQIAFAPLCLLLALTGGSAFAQGNDIKIAFIEDLSGPAADRGKSIMEVYKKYVDDLNRAGGLSIGGTRRPIRAMYFDSGSDMRVAAEKVRRAAIQEQAVLLVCSHASCLQPAEEARTPLILTASGFSLSGVNATTFLINAPGRDDFEKQAVLARTVLHEALSRSGEPTRDDILAALRLINIKTDEGSVRFDQTGNNIGPVSFRLSPASRPDAAGCTNMCAKTCPSDCNGSCSASGDNQCCSVCSRPIQSR
jgi:hypothetical protein